MTGWILRAILFLVIVRIIWRFVASIVEGLTSDGGEARGGRGSRGGSGRGAAKASVPLVRDPVCGKYVVQARALTGGRGNQVQYFCSEQCRDEFARRA